MANLAPDPHQPYVGASAFAHKGGIHVAAMLKVEDSYQHIDPTLVGNEQARAGERAVGPRQPDLQGAGVRRGCQQGRGAAGAGADQGAGEPGFYFEGAEASVALMLRRLQPGYRPPFELIDFMVVVEHRQGRGLFAEATRQGARSATRSCTPRPRATARSTRWTWRCARRCCRTIPQLADVQLADYKVRILDGDAATGATTRVIIDTQQRPPRLEHRRRSTNIIESSWQALADSMEYALVA